MDNEKGEHLFTAARSAKWYSHHGNQCGVSSKKLEINLPHVSALPCLHRCSRSLHLTTEMFVLQ